MTTNLRLALRDDLDVAAAADTFARAGRVRVPDVLTDKAATQLRDLLAQQETWVRVFLHNGVHRTADAAGVAAKPEMMRAVREAARPVPGAFGYTYDNLPLYDMHHRGVAHPLSVVYPFLNDPNTLGVFSQITGRPVGFADCQATRYGPGDFLTEHDDGVAGKRRIAAYVLSLTDDWRDEHGGALRFADTNERWYPRFGALSLFAVPTPHEVDPVASDAPRPRYAITGWLREGADPGAEE